MTKTKTLRSKLASYMPGDKSREMTFASISSDGRLWPAGTVYQPLCAGYDNGRGSDYQDVTIAGERVRFYLRA